MTCIRRWLARQVRREVGSSCTAGVGQGVELARPRPLFLLTGDQSKWQVGRRAEVDWMREETDCLVAGDICASQDAESCGTTLGDSQREVPGTHSKRPSGDLSDVEVKPFSGQLCPKGHGACSRPQSMAWSPHLLAPGQHPLS